MNGVQAQQEAEAMFEIMHADLLLTFDKRELCNVVAAYMRTDGITKINLASDDEHDYLVLMEQAFVELYNRGALAPAPGRPFSSRGQSDLNTLLQTYRVTPASERPVVIPTDPCEEVVQAFKTMSGSDFGKWIREDTSNGRAELFEEASIRNLI